VGKSRAAREVPIASTRVGPIPETSPAPSAPTVHNGWLVVDALPWAEIVRVDDASGQNWLTVAEAYTPMVLALPSGKYSVVMRNADFPDKTVSKSVEVREGASTSCVGRFQPTDPVAYFEMEGWRR
jgi:hypothetical protein